MTDFERKVMEAAMDDAYLTKHVPTKNILEFAHAIRAIVGEECAKVCEGLFDLEDDSCDEAEKCAAAIRELTKGE